MQNEELKTFKVRVNATRKHTMIAEVTAKDSLQALLIAEQCAQSKQAPWETSGISVAEMYIVEEQP